MNRKIGNLWHLPALLIAILMMAAALVACEEDTPDLALSQATAEEESNMSAWIEIQYQLEQSKATIDRIQTLDDGAVLSFSASGSLSIADYFGAVGRGHDSTVSIQTTEGRVDIPIASNTISLTDDTITLNVPQDGRGIVNNIAEGTKFIFAIHRPSEG